MAKFTKGGTILYLCKASQVMQCKYFEKKEGEYIDRKYINKCKTENI